MTEGTATFLLDRIAAGRTDLALEWVRAGNPPDATDMQGTPIALWCAYYGDVSALRFLLTEGLAPAILGDNLGLDAAAFHGHWRLCQFLLEAGADPDRALNDTGEVPLHAALCSRESAAHERVVKVLLAAGARVDRATIAGMETGGFMRDVRTRGEQPLHRAAAFGTAGAIRLLLDAGAGLEARDANGDTPLGWASWALRSPDILSMLCYGPHRVRPDRKGMQINLLGEPLV